MASEDLVLLLASEVALPASWCSSLMRTWGSGWLFCTVELPAPDASMETGPSLGNWERGCDEGR
jgi:hypothetical protein